jgi:excinuclease ABC subunit C
VLAQVRRLPAEPGVYRFRDAAGRVLYVGRAGRLRDRVGSYWSDLGDRPHLARMVARVARVEALVCDSAHEAAWLERNLLEERLPRWNRTPGGQEVPVHLALDDGPARPGLRLTHRPEPGAIFGPYLGGRRARLALSGVQRIHPLPYAGSRLTGAERDMADRLGVGPADRPALVAAIRAVLDRDPAAVADAERRLTELRDEAAGELRFERAGRLQSELEGVRWVTAVQRATTLDGADLEFDAWADGVLVRFAIRGGRLCAWVSRRTGTAPHAGPPAAWAAFAQRNAALAAALS